MKSGIFSSDPGPTNTGAVLVLRPGRDRAGTGAAFVLVMVVLVVLAISGMAVKYFTRGATRVAESVLAGEQAVSIAQAALAEAWSFTECMVNEPSTDLHKQLTDPLVIGAGNELGFTIYPKTTKLFFSNDPNVEISDVKLVCPRQYPIWHRDPFEKLGIIGAEVTVRVYRPAVKRWAARTLTQFREFKVVYPSPPRPLDRFTLFVTVPDFLVGYEKQYRTLQVEVAKSLHKAQKKLNKKYKKWHKKAPHIPRPFEHNKGPIYKYFPKYKYPPFPYNARAQAPADYNSPIPPEQSDMDNHLISIEPLLKGDDFKLRWPTKLDDKISDFENKIKQALKTYSDRFLFLGEDKLADYRDCYLCPLLNVDSSGVITVDKSIQYYKEYRCTHVFPDEAALWAEVGKPNCYLDGIYYVDGPILDVDILYRGKGTIISKERMVVNRCRKDPADPNRDFSICTLMSFSHALPGMTTWRSIELNCDPQAGIVAVAGMVKNLHEHNIVGSLAVGLLGEKVIDGLPGQDKMYPWSLTYDPNLCHVNVDGSALRTDRSRVIFSPTVPFARLRRQ